jgi:hypothetical protein
LSACGVIQGSYATSFAFDPAGHLIVALANSGTPNVPDLLEFPQDPLDTDCPIAQGNISIANGAATRDISIDDRGYVYGIDYATSYGAVWSLDAVYQAFPNSYPTPYATIGSGLSQVTSLAVWNGTTWLGGNARHRHVRR